MNCLKWLTAVGPLTFVLLALASFGVVAFKLVGATGISRIVFMASLISINACIFRDESDLPGEFRKPRGPTTPDDKK